MATALAEDHSNSHMIMDEFSPEPEYPPIVSNNTNTNTESTLPRYISFEIDITESLSQPDIIDHTHSKQREEKMATPDLSQPTYLDIPEGSLVENTKNVLEEEEIKLVDWVFNMYVPTCKSLLECCLGNSVDLKTLQQYLKLLSNSITFFCNEHQQIQKQREISSSKSFTGLDNYDDNHSPLAIATHSLSPPPFSVHNRQSSVSQSQTSVSVKVLRSISSSLLPPLLKEVTGEFTSKLFHDIVVAVQKISWKVEACLSFCNVIDDSSAVHDKVFNDSIVTMEMRDVMIASPPEEMKIQNSPAHLAVFGLKEDQISLDSDMEAYWEKQRRRDNSIGDIMSQETGREGYFRPGRRTTVSISKRQIESLGLNVVDATAPDSLSPKRSNTVGISKNVINIMEDDSESFVSIRDRVLKKLAKEFPQFQTDSEDPNEMAPKRPSTLPVNSGSSQLHSINETRSSSAPLPPINQGPINHICIRERHSLEPPSTMKEELSGKMAGNLGERTKSLEFERVSSGTQLSPVQSSDTRPIDLVQSNSSSKLSPSKSNSNTMPTKRRETFVKMVKKKARSFGRADSRVKQRAPVYLRAKTTSEFFSPNEDRNGSESPIEQFVLKAHPREGSCRSSDYDHFLNIDILDKLALSPRRRRFSVSTNIRHPTTTTIEMNVTTDIPDLEKKRYTIQRSLKDTLALYDLLLSTTVTAGCLPERPDRRAKEWRVQVEEFFQFVASSPELRTVPEFVSFMKPGEMNAESNATLYKESEFELLTTFFTPFTYSAGLPGTHHEVDIVGKDLTTPTAHNPARSRRSYPSISNGRGSIHVKRSGDEEATFIIREEGKDVLIISEDHDRFVVVAGTFKKLVEQLACEEKPDPKYVTTFLLGHRHFASSEDLVNLLIKRFKMTEAPDATEEELAYAEKWKYVIQLRVLDIISYWMKSFWSDFQRSPQALILLQELIQSLHSSSDSNFSSAATSMSNTLASKLTTLTKNKRHSSSSSSTLSSPTHSTSISPMHRTLSSNILEINSFSGIQLARQLTLIELEFLRAIEVYEFAFYTWGSNDEGRQYRKNLDAYIARFNKVSYWVASEILNLQDERHRAVMIEKFIDVAKHSQELKNFNSTVSIVTGLSSTCVRRLEKSWKHVSERGLRAFNKLKGLITPTNNHSEYRKTLYTVSPREACIPYFGVFMRDITLCNEGTPKKLKNGLYNFSKLRTLVTMFEDIRRYQRSKFQFPSDDRVQNYCMNIWSMEEHELYDVSCTLEPRIDQIISDSCTQ